ncbi:hypothetical protein [Pseudanabaena sp. FACHB-2040]|uniref:hypothetical protein n=1 Tax=Pseudanabaena sp. FACHB-2040 TaxID=2692859 RepID=UPI001689D13A|nr:hypothetical protein [Pseudanabaena sp. FACHB-2040]MBD2256234.1 hypothetical protein [Pseudanabaena sp. FACHB-2040]
MLSQPAELSSWRVVPGIVVPGHQVASGRATHSPYPRGTIEMQMPHFQARGLDLGPVFLGTLNVSIAPLVPKLVQPEITLAQVKWSPHHPAETFSFCRCQVEFGQQLYPGWIYYPHPETKPAHFQAPSTLEVLAPAIAGLAYGAPLQLALNPQAVHIAHSIP